MKRFLLLACILLCVSVAHAGCDEMKAAIANLEKAIQFQSTVIAGNVTDTSFTAKRIRDQAQAEIERLMKLRSELYQQECFKNPVSKPKPNVQPRRNKKFKPAWKWKMR